MLTHFSELEGAWLEAVRRCDISTLETILDNSFVSTPWTTKGDLLLRGQYLREVEETKLESCDVRVIDVQELESFAIVRCRMACEYWLEHFSAKAEFFITDVWVRYGEDWKALNRHTTVATQVIH